MTPSNSTELPHEWLGEKHSQNTDVIFNSMAEMVSDQHVFV